MRLKITSIPNRNHDGPERVAVVCAETGEEVRWVRKVSIVADLTTDFIPIATIEVEADIDLDAIGLIEAKKVFA